MLIAKTEFLVGINLSDPDLVSLYEFLLLNGYPPEQTVYNTPRMANGDNSSLVLERKKQKQREIKKNQQNRKAQRIDKIKNYDIKGLKSRIQRLELKKTDSGGKLPFHEEKQLRLLQDDLKLLIQYKGLDVSDDGNKGKTEAIQLPELPPTQPEATTPDRLYKKSIFYEPEWNPLGQSLKSRPDLPNLSIPIPQEYKFEYAGDEELAHSVPMPIDPQPKFYKLKDVSGKVEKAAISSAELIRQKIQKEFVLPSHLILKQRKAQEDLKVSSQGPMNNGESSDDDDDDDEEKEEQEEKKDDKEGEKEFGDMAEEEEEYWRNHNLKRKLSS